jgi:hypothetical protein
MMMRTQLGPVLRSRARRAALRASTAIVIAFVLSWMAPAAALAVSPLVLGIPHIASSFRYLVLRQRFPRWALALLAIPALAVMGFRILEQYGSVVPFAARIEVGIGVGWAFGAAIFGARATPRRLWFVLPGLAALAAFGLSHPIATRLAFVHVHNLGAVAAWVLLFRRRDFFVPMMLLVVALSLLVSGAVAPLTTTGLGVDHAVVGQWLAPGLAASVAVPLVLAHVFTDSVHYAFWLGVIPEETLRGEGSLTFRMTMRGLVRDFGVPGLAFVAAAMIGFGAFALFGAARARDAYFAIAGFHGYVEGAMLVYLLCALPSGASGGAVQRPAEV